LVDYFIVKVGVYTLVKKTQGKFEAEKKDTKQAKIAYCFKKRADKSFK